MHKILTREYVDIYLHLYISAHIRAYACICVNMYMLDIFLLVKLNFVDLLFVFETNKTVSQLADATSCLESFVIFLVITNKYALA